MLTYAITIFTGAFLLFQVEPLLARYILPWFGGTSAVWITCMLFFQLLLVVGYAYSHLIATRLQSRMQAIVHIAIVCACVLLMGTLALTWQSAITPGRIGSLLIPISPSQESSSSWWSASDCHSSSCPPPGRCSRRGSRDRTKARRPIDCTRYRTSAR